MRALALAGSLVLLCATEVRAAGETFSLRWTGERYCPDAAPLHDRRGGYLSVVSDTQLVICTDLFLCPVDPAPNVSGTTTRISAHRAVFVGVLENDLVYGGPTTIEADLVLGANGAVRSVRGTFVTPAIEDAYGGCAARGRLRTQRRTD